MSRVWLLLAAVCLSLGLLAACDKAEENTNTITPGGTGEPGIPDEIAIARDIAPVLANGVDAVDIFVTVVDGKRRALSDVGVSFSTTAGTIDPFATTDEDGVAETRLTAAASVTDLSAVVTAATSADSASGAPLPGDAFVLITRERVSPELVSRAYDRFRGGIAEGVTRTAVDITDQVTVAMVGITLTLDATPTTLPADGASTSRVTANLVETTTRIPLEGEDVRFGSTAGSITGRVSTNASGSALALLTSTEAGQTATITAFYGNLLTAEASVTFSALSLALASGVPGIADDGTYVTPVTASLINAENNPVSGVTLEFTTDAGTITSPAVTGDDGVASATLRTDPSLTLANLVVRFGDLNTGTAVAFAPLQFSVTAGSPSIAADGLSSTTVTALLTTDGGDPLDGVRIRFTTTAGTISSSATTGEDGRATATLISGNAPGSATITASYAGGTEVSTTVTFTSAPTPSSLVLTADDLSVLADGLASTTISATITDALGNPPPAGTAVEFLTTRGVIDNVLPTDASGVATARLTAARFETGLARVTGVLDDLQGAVDVKFTSESAAQIVILDVENPSIGVRGAGDLETAVLTYQVRDANGIPVDADHPATLDFRIVPVTGEIDATVNPASATTNEDGAVIATVQSGVISGAIELEASSGTLVSKPIRIAIHGGLPDPAHFSVAPEFLNIAGLVFDGIRNGITARVGDVHGNPVPTSTAVWFEADFGLVQGSAFTDDHGEATVWEVTAAPRPAIPGGDGLVEVTAQTVSAAGDLITTSTNVMWSGPTIIEITGPAAGFSVPNAGSIEITFVVRDANFNPLTGGTGIAVETSTGELGGTTDFVLPDTQDSAFTTFSVVLLDANPEEDLAESVTVTISVESQNGNRQASITGIIN